MQAIITVGLDIAKSVFHFHGVDAAGNVVIRQRDRGDLGRPPSQQRCEPGPMQH